MTCSCRKCGGVMVASRALAQTFVGGEPDFPGDTHSSTFSAGGPGELINCMKCEDCGWSVTNGGLERQFAALMADDAWEDGDDPLSAEVFNTLYSILHSIGVNHCPGIGTNGQGSITAAWTEGENRLTIECLPSGKASLVLSRVMLGGEVERASFGPMCPERVGEVLAPFNPEIWFDNGGEK